MRIGTSFFGESRIKSVLPFFGPGACAGKIPVGSQIASEWAKKYDYPMEDSDDLIKVAQFVAVTKDAMIPKEEMCRKINELLKKSHKNTLKLLMNFMEC